MKGMVKDLHSSRWIIVCRGIQGRQPMERYRIRQGWKGDCDLFRRC